LASCRFEQGRVADARRRVKVGVPADYIGVEVSRNNTSRISSGFSSQQA
jgi:hypothetical protein